MAPKSPERLRTTAAAFRRRLLLVGVLVRLANQSSEALRMINLDAPDSALQGDTIQLSCLYKLAGQTNQSHAAGAAIKLPPDPADLDGIQNENAAIVTGQLGKQLEGDQEERVYAIKWYKDGQEFFRYIAQEGPFRPDKQFFPLDGISLDVSS